MIQHDNYNITQLQFTVGILLRCTREYGKQKLKWKETKLLSMQKEAKMRLWRVDDDYQTTGH